MNINQLEKREREIIKELNEGNTNNMSELLGIAKNLYSFYEPCEKCNFISKHKETKECKNCIERLL